MDNHDSLSSGIRDSYFSDGKFSSIRERDSCFSEAKPERPLFRERYQELTVETLTSRRVASQRSLARSIAIVAACTGATIVNSLNAISVSISLPQIGDALDIQQDELQWVLSAYSLSSGCLLLFFGRLADLYGRKKAFMIGMLWQLAFSLGLGFSTNGLMLIILRGFQGMGAAAAIPAAVGILANSFPPSRARSIAFATFSAGIPVGGAFGTMIGGVLTQLSKEHWRAPFFLSAAMSGVCALGGLLSFSRDEISLEEDRRVDWIGAFFVTGGLVLIVFALGQGPNAGWQHPYIIACLTIGVTLLGLFTIWEYRLEASTTDSDEPSSFLRPPPLMKLSIWARAEGRMSVILIIAFLTLSGFVSWSFWVQLYYQDYLQLTPVLTMIRFIPMFVTGVLLNFFVAMVVSKLSLVVLIVLGSLITGFACVLFALIDPSATYWAFEFPSTILVVFGADFVVSAGSIFVAKIVLPQEQSLAGGLFQTMTRVGSAFGLTISTIVSKAVVDTQSAKLGVAVNSTTPSIPASVVLQGYKAAQWTNSGLLFLAALLALLFLRNVGIVGDTGPAQPDSPGGRSDSMEQDPMAVAQP